MAQTAYPISNREASYVKAMSAYVDSYEDFHIYTKSGLSEGSLLCTVTYETKFSGVDTAAPGSDTFYLVQGDDGSYHIDNAYSWFNLLSGENETDTTISDRLSAYNEEEDVAAVVKRVDRDYVRALAANSDLNTMVTETVTKAVTDWASSDDAKNASGNIEAKVQEDSSDADENNDDENKDTKEASAGDDNTGEDTSADDDENDTETDDTETDDTAAETDDTETKSEEKVEDGFGEGDEIYCEETVIVRSKRSKKSDRVETCYGGERLKVIKSYADGWTKVKIKGSGKKGYVLTSLLREQSY